MAIGWAIISCGDYADSRGAPGINEAEGAELVAVHSRDQGRADAFAKKHGAKTAYTSVEDVLADARINAVYITSPNHLHAEYTRMAANAGKHVLVEKPLSLNMAEGEEVLRVCEDRGVRVGVGLHLRHHPGHIETRRLVAEGALGTVALAQSQIGQGERGNVHSVPRAGLRDWWTHPELVGGAFAMLTIGVHAIDDLQFLLGQQVVELTAITDGQTPERPLEDLATMCLRFDGGTIGTMCCGMRLPEFQNDVALYGSDGKVMLADGSWPRLQGELRVSSETVNTTVAYEPDHVYLVARNIEDFQRAIAENREPAASGKHGLKLVQLTEAMVESAKAGRTIKLEPLG
jgi:1,5-anhydro-D-fructose reductase (1,5-anhydro-D-mannitol-forming)|tara:strand:+ start:696 stop:1733 length:1038 start_codon:yes stop_codon:yes gene_type:complete